MHKQNLLTITLIVTGLALNPVMAESELHTVSKNIKIKHSVKTNISNLLHNRGLDEDVADVLAENLVSEEDEMLLAMLIENLEVGNIVSKNDVLAYLSNAALYKQKLDFRNYDTLVGMVSKIKQKSLDTYTLKQLSHLATINKQLFV